MAAHPDDHERDHRHRDRGDDRLEPLLLSLRQLPVENLQADGDAGAEQRRPRPPRPTSPQGVASALLAQERGDDADDQGRLDALAQADHKCWQHVL